MGGLRKLRCIRYTIIFWLSLVGCGRGKSLKYPHSWQKTVGLPTFFKQKPPLLLYMTREQALQKMGVDLGTFRTLCILKGVYPREPPHGFPRYPEGSDDPEHKKLYYHKVDINRLRKDVLTETFAKRRDVDVKIKKHIVMRKFNKAREWAHMKPDIELDHIIKERYPTFVDALRDADDAISMLAAFNSGSFKGWAAPQELLEATALFHHFEYYVIRTQALRKVYASLKGYYFQADIMGTTVTWLTPHRKPDGPMGEDPDEQEVKGRQIMLAFLAFYRAFMKFVNFQLYWTLGMKYPPEIDSVNYAEPVAKFATDQAPAPGAKGTPENLRLEEVVQNSPKKTLFANMKVFINSEVPFRPIYLTLVCGGATQVGWDSKESPFGSDDPGITHQIGDKPLYHVYFNREYVQSQWVLDSFNFDCHLPAALYVPGKTPPPHLSPFEDNTAEKDHERAKALMKSKYNWKTERVEAIKGPLQTYKQLEEAPVAPESGSESALEARSDDVEYFMPGMSVVIFFLLSMFGLHWLRLFVRKPPYCPDFARVSLTQRSQQIAFKIVGGASEIPRTIINFCQQKARTTE